MFGWNRAMLEGDTPDSRHLRSQSDIWWSQRLGYHVTPVGELQHVGTNLIRNHLHQDFWLFHIQREIKQHERVVVTDCRYENEARFLKELGAMFVWILRPPMPIWFNGSETNTEQIPLQLHTSETTWFRTGVSPDLVLENNFSSALEFQQHALPIAKDCFKMV